MGTWVLNVLIGLDQFANTLIGGAPDETISSRASRARTRGARWGRWLCACLDWLDPGHCQDAQHTEETGGHHEKETSEGE